MEVHHKPRPIHAWREFLQEVGIIVLGVLIALGAEQVVDAFHWRKEVAEFRGAADRELAYDLAAFQYRLAQSSCVERRVAELRRWRDAQRTGHAGPLQGEIGRPSLLTFRAGVWGARSPEVMTHMSLDHRIAYSSLYDRLASTQAQVSDEREAWRSLAAFNDARQLSPDSLMRLGELLYRVDSIDRIIRLTQPLLLDDARALGIQPRLDTKHIPYPDPGFCKSLLASH